MLKRLEELFDVDTASRWRILATSALTIATLGAALEITHQTVRNAQIVATVLGGGVFLAQIAGYCLRRPANEPTRAGSWQVSTLAILPRRLAAPQWLLA